MIIFKKYRYWTKKNKIRQLQRCRIFSSLDFFFFEFFVETNLIYYRRKKTSEIFYFFHIVKLLAFSTNITVVVWKSRISPGSDRGVLITLWLVCSNEFSFDRPLFVFPRSFATDILAEIVQFPEDFWDLLQQASPHIRPSQNRIFSILPLTSKIPIPVHILSEKLTRYGEVVSSGNQELCPEAGFFLK